MGRNKGDKGTSSSKRGEKEKNAAKGTRKRIFYENKWFKNPLNDREVQRTIDFATAVIAYEAIPEIIQAMEEAQGILKRWLLKHNQIEPDEEEEEEDSDSDISDPEEDSLAGALAALRGEATSKKSDKIEEVDDEEDEDVFTDINTDTEDEAD